MVMEVISVRFKQQDVGAVSFTAHWRLAHCICTGVLATSAFHPKHPVNQTLSLLNT